MGCAIHPIDDESRPPIGRAMTRCECSGLSFDDAARHVLVDGLSLDELSRRTGCGGTCTACVPDLRRYLAALTRRP
jgi:bacterioferritin-associated ferredoxin